MQTMRILDQVVSTTIGLNFGNMGTSSQWDIQLQIHKTQKQLR